MSFVHPRLDTSGWLECASHGSLWFSFEHCEVYLRQGRRLIESEPAFVVEISNLNSPRRYHRSGQFYRLVDYIARTSPMSWIVVENVLNAGLADSLRRRGWAERPGERGWPPSFYKQMDAIRTSQSLVSFPV